MLCLRKPPGHYDSKFLCSDCIGQVYIQISEKRDLVLLWSMVIVVPVCESWKMIILVNIPSSFK